MAPNRLVLAWNSGALGATLIPLLSFWGSRWRTARYDDDNDNNNNDDDEYNNCSWWKVWCNNGQQDENNDRQEGSPWWWIFGEQDEPDREGAGGMLFAYLWTLVLFAGLVWWGNQLLGGGGGGNNNSNVSNSDSSPLPTLPARGQLMTALLGYANIAFLCLILVASNVEVEGREIEETGWYGQFSVLMVLTCLLELIYCFTFVGILRYCKGEGSTTTDRETELMTGYQRDTTTTTSQVDSGNTDLDASTNDPSTENHKHKEGGWFDMPAWLT